MELKKITLAILCTGIFTQPVKANELSDLKAQLQVMQQQIQIMQSKLSTQDIALKKQEQVSSELKYQQSSDNQSDDLNLAGKIAHSITVGGVIEVVANNTDSDGWSGQSASNIVLDTFELGIDASAGNWVSASVLLLYEDASDDNLNVDETFITIANSDVTPFYLSAGRLYVPFGNFESNMISDPATLTLGETREDIVQVGFETEGGFYGSTYIFNGDTDEAKSGYSSVDNNLIDNYGLNFGYAMEKDNFGLDVGLGYINNIGTSDTLQDSIDSNGLCAGNGCIMDYVDGLSLHAVATFGQFNLIGEYVAALESFAADELSSVNNKKLKPKAWNIEGAYNFEIAGKDTTLALGYQKTKDMLLDDTTTDYFEKAWLLNISIGILDQTTLAAEWRHADSYNEVKNVSGNGVEDLLQIKLSYEF
ncbi:MAG: LbtU family siderophore porin [Pseudomonadota bacterium]